MSEILLWTLFFICTFVADLVIFIVAYVLAGGVVALLISLTIPILVAIFTLYLGYRPVTEYQEWQIHLFGKWIKKWEAGLRFLFPYFGWMKVYSKIYMGEQIIKLYMDEQINQGFGYGKVDFSNASAPVTAFVYFTIVDSKKATYSVVNIYKAIEEKMDNAIRTFLAQFTLDEAIEVKVQFELSNILNGDLHQKDISVTPPKIILPAPQSIDQIPSWLELKNQYGVQINKIIISDIALPDKLIEIRERILEASKEKEAAALKKETRIIEAEATKQSTMIVAEGDKEALMRRGEGLTKQVKLLVTRGLLTQEEAVGYLKERVKWENVKDKTVIIETGTSGIAGLGAQFAAGMKTSGGSSTPTQNSPNP